MFNVRHSFFDFFIKLTTYFKSSFNLIQLLSKIVFSAIKFAVNFVCKKLYNCFRDVCDETGILALKLMFNGTLHLTERLFWLVTFLGAVYGALLITKIQIFRHLNSPTVISVDRNYRDWDGFMPAITLCYYDQIDSTRASEYIQKQWNISTIDQDYLHIMDFLYTVVNATVNNYAGLVNFAEDKRFDNIDLYEAVQAIEKSFEQILNTFEGNIELPVSMARTERGSCYIINSAIGQVLSSNLRSFEHLKPPLKCKFSKQKCFIKIDLLERTGMLDVHSPFEISSAGANLMALQKSDEIIASYKVLETVATSNLRDLRFEQRNCVFNDEETSDLKIYSKTLCMAKCRAMTAIEFCNCVPFFYKFVDGPPCNIGGFQCLDAFKWPDFTLNCKCPSTCIDVEYTLQSVKKSSWGVNIIDAEVDSSAVISSFRWELIPPKVRMQRDVVFSFEDLLVSFGGTLALFLGFNILSLISMIYTLAESILQGLYFFLHLFFMCCRHVRKITLKSRKLKKEINIVRDRRVRDNVTYLERIKERHAKLLEKHILSKDAIIYMDHDHVVDQKDQKADMTNNSSVLEYVN